jgi:hypothetical protein
MLRIAEAARFLTYIQDVPDLTSTQDLGYQE